jgi:hypothetical protein
MLSILLGIFKHPLSLLAGITIGYLCPGSVSQAIAWVKSKF